MSTQLDEGQATLNAQRAAAQQMLDEAAARLADAQAQADEGQATLDSNRTEFESSKADALARIAEARANGGESIVLTFEPHPRITLGKAEGLRLLTTLDEKTALLEELGVDNVIVIPFDRAFSALSGEEFADDYLIGKVGAETLVAGYNHRFGHDRIDCDTLAASGRLRVVKVGPCRVDGEHVSSTVIRRLLDEGKTAEAELLLGYSLQTEK